MGGRREKRKALEEKSVCKEVAEEMLCFYLQMKTHAGQNLTAHWKHSSRLPARKS